MTEETLSGLPRYALQHPKTSTPSPGPRSSELPASFRRLCEGLVIQVVDFPDEETLKEMGAESEFDLLGLFRGRGLAQGAAAERRAHCPT